MCEQSPTPSDITIAPDIYLSIATSAGILLRSRRPGHLNALFLWTIIWTMGNMGMEFRPRQSFDQTLSSDEDRVSSRVIVKLRRGSGKDWQGMAPKAKGLKA